MCKNEAVEDNLLNSMYVVSNCVLNEEPIPNITGRYSMIDYVYDGIHVDEYVADIEATAPQPTTPQNEA